MGYPMAGHLAGRYETLVHNRTRAKAEQHAAAYGSRAVELLEVSQAEVICSCLPLTRDVVQVAGALETSLKPGTVWVDHTSGEPEASRALAERLAKRGVSYLDAPVSGGTNGAETGKLTIMVGGDAKALEQVRPIIQNYAAKLVQVGPVGAGHAVKAINNTLLAANLWAAGEGLLALVKQGVSAEVALQVINASSGRSNASENLIGEWVVNRTFPLTFKLGLLAKDLGIGMQVLDSSATPGMLLRSTYELFEIARREIGRDQDHVAALKLLERWAQTEIR